MHITTRYKISNMILGFKNFYQTFNSNNIHVILIKITTRVIAKLNELHSINK